MGLHRIRIRHFTCLLWTVLFVPGFSQDNVPSDDLPASPAEEMAPAEPVTPIDPARTEALALYMQGIEAQTNNDLPAALDAFKKAALADPTSADPVRAQALLLLRMGEVDQGVEQARAAIVLDDGDFRTRFQLATVLLRRQPLQQNIPEAIRLMDEALKSERLTPTEPEYILIHSVRGRVLMQLRQPAKAAESYAVLLDALERPDEFGLDFRRHKALVDDRLTGYAAVGEALLAVGRTEEAVRAFRALVRIKGDDSGRHNLLLATALFRTDDIPGAEENLNEYFSAGLREKGALELLKQVYSATSRSSQLIEKLKELTADTTESAAVMLYMAEIQMQQGRIEDAVATLERVIIDSGDPAAYSGLMRIDIVRADADSFIKTLQKALRARVQLSEVVPFLPEIVNDSEFAQRVVQASLQEAESNSGLFPEVTFVCAQIALEIGASDEHGKLLQVTLDHNPNQQIGQSTLQQLGMHHLRNARTQEAATAFRKLLSIRTLPARSRVEVLTNLAKAESIGDHYDKAIEAMEAAFQLQPNDPELHYWLGWVHLNADKVEIGRESVQESIRIAGERQNQALQNSARMLLASSYSLQREWDNCVQEYRQVLASPAGDNDTQRRARLLLSAVLVESGDNDEAEAVLEELYAQQPDDPGVNNDLGYLYADHNKNLEQALEMIQLAVDADPENRAYLDSLGWVLYRLERYADALEALQKANSDPEFQDATLQEHLGDVYKAMKQDDKADEMWRKALVTEESSSEPDAAVINRLRGRLGEESEGDKEASTEPDVQESVPTNAS